MRVLVTGGSGNVGAYALHVLARHHTVVNLDVRPSRLFPKVPFLKVDLADPAATLAAVRDFDVVVHLAAIPNPFNDPGDRIIGFNIVTTYNLLEAVRAAGIRRVVYGCSESATGFGLHNVAHIPEYVPIDEEHPLWPHESYSLSKYFGERMCEEYSRAYGIEAISLRYGCVWLDAISEEIEQILSHRPDAGFGAYVFPEDVARAVALAAGCDMSAWPSRFEAFFVMAEKSVLSVPTVRGVEAHCGRKGIPVRPEGYFRDDPYRSAFNIEKARRLLAFDPQFAAEDFRGPKRWRLGDPTGHAGL